MQPNTSRYAKPQLIGMLIEATLEATANLSSRSMRQGGRTPVPRTYEAYFGSLDAAKRTALLIRGEGDDAEVAYGEADYPAVLDWVAKEVGAERNFRLSNNYEALQFPIALRTKTGRMVVDILPEAEPNPGITEIIAARRKFAEALDYSYVAMPLRKFVTYCLSADDEAKKEEASK